MYAPLIMENLDKKASIEVVHMMISIYKRSLIHFSLLFSSLTVKIFI